jgi:UDP:flavonoid glycosyltransferase YjiC (YdhE family)
MITTGGAGSVLAALQVGVPLVVVPTNWDKPDNAQRLVSAGVGIRLSPWRCTPARLRQAVVRLLEDPSYGANARGIADRLRAEPGPAGAASLLEALAPRASQTPPSPTLATA